MTETEHRAVFDSLGAYALGALPEPEARAVEAHLERCPICAEDAALLRSTASGLLESVPPVAPSPELRSRIMAVVESEAALRRAAGAPARAVRPARPRRRFGLRALQPRWVAAAAALLVAGGVAGALWPAAGGGRTRTIAAQAGTSADRAWLEVQGGSAELVVRGLAAPRPEKVYEVWIQSGTQQPQPAGALFVVRSGRIGIPAPVSEGDRVMVSEEPAGGSPAPTTAPVIVSARV